MTEQQSKTVLSIAMTIEQWITVLAAVSVQVKGLQPIIETLRADTRVDPTNLSSEVALICQPILTQAKLVDALADAGVLDDAAAEKAGLASLRRKSAKAWTEAAAEYRAVGDKDRARLATENAAACKRRAVAKVKAT